MAYKYFSIICLFIWTLGLTFTGGHVHGASIYKLEPDSTTTAKNSPKKKSRISDKMNKSTEVHFGFKPFSPLAGSTQRALGAETDKLLSNVKVFPTQVSDQLNISFKLTKDSNVAVKVMDALGNEVTTLLSQRLPAGEQNNSFNVGSKLNQGFYFIRVVAGSETIVKRIEVL